MPILELFPKPAQSSDPPESRNPAGATPLAGSANAGSTRGGRPVGTTTRIKVRTGRFGELEEHELVHLLDTLDDERARARFRESIYISVIVYLALAWLLFYGPRVLFHIPQYRDPIAVMKEHDQQLTLNLPRMRPVPRPAPKIDRKTMEALRKAQLEAQARQAPPTPQPPVEQPAPPPPEVARNTAPPVPQPAIPLPTAPKPAAPSVELPAAPRPNFAQNSESPGEALQRAARGSLGARNGGEFNSPSPSGPLQAGAEILSDTQGVDFSAYMRQLHHDIQRNWDPLIPEEVQAPLLKRGIVGIIFSILPDGQIGNIKLETTSGDVALDKAAWYAITSEGQFPPLPKAFHGPDLELRVGFFYNEPIQQ